MTSHSTTGTREDERIPPDATSESTEVHRADVLQEDSGDTAEDDELLVSYQPAAVLSTYSPKAFALLALRGSESVLRGGAHDLLHGDAEDNLEDLASDLDVLSDNIRVYLWNRHKARNPDAEANSGSNDEQHGGESGT